MTIHSLRYEYGQAKQVRQGAINVLLAKDAWMNLCVHFLGSDGDRGFSSGHKQFFQCSYPILRDQSPDADLAFGCPQLH
jgi:hypothetical protein